MSDFDGNQRQFIHLTLLPDATKAKRTFMTMWRVNRETVVYITSTGVLLSDRVPPECFSGAYDPYR